MRAPALVLACIILFVVSCSNNDEPKVEEPPIAITISVEDFTLEIDENPNNGASLGKVNASTNSGKLQFSIEEEEPSGALSIDLETGELRVKDSLYFDFERFPKIEASVKAKNADLSKNIAVTITVNNFQNSDYVRMIDPGVVLVEKQYFVYEIGDVNNLVRYYYGDIEIKDGQEYRPFYRQRISNSQTIDGLFTYSDKVEEPNLLYWAREDDETQKVFMYYLDYAGNGYTELLHDFSAKVGDTVSVSIDYYEFRQLGTLIVESIDSVALTNGEHRKRINYLWGERPIVEGIGRILKHDYNFGSAARDFELLYYLKDGELLLDANGDYNPNDWKEGGLPSLDLENVYQFDGQFLVQSNKSSDGGNFVENNIIENGVCWSSTSTNPTIHDNVNISEPYQRPYYKNMIGGLGPFYTVIDQTTNLEPNTSYYIRSYAKNANGISYSDPVEAFNYSIDLNTENANMETVGDTVHITIKGQVTNIDLPTATSIVEKGIAIDLVSHYGFQIPFPTENNAALIPVQEGSLDNFEYTSAINWRYLYDPVYPYSHHAFWTYVKLSNGAVIFGNKVQVDANG